MVEERSLAYDLNAAAEVLEARSEQILTTYEKRLLATDNLFLVEREAREQLRAQVRLSIEAAAATLRGWGTPSSREQREDPRSGTRGAARLCGGVYAIESLRTVVTLFEAVLTTVMHELPHSRISLRNAVMVAVIIQQAIMECVTRACVSYYDLLLAKLHESHVDERRRISRELHDRVAHSIMAIFRSLEIYEIYEAKDPLKAEYVLDSAKGTAQEVVDLLRNVSMELRNTSAPEGLEVALSDLLSTSVPQTILYRVSIEGDENLIPSHMREELFLVLREGIRNAIAHSGASSIKVKLNIAESAVWAVIEDDGCGFEPWRKATRGCGTGLTSMEERVSLLSGALKVNSIPDKGTRIEVFLPLPSFLR